MKSVVITSSILAIVIIAWLCLASLGGLLNAWAENTAAAKLAQGQADSMRIAAQSAADAQLAYTGAGVRAIDADRRVAHGASAAQVAVVAVVVCAVCGAIAWLAWRLRMTEAQLRAVIAAGCAQVGAVAEVSHD